MIAAILKAAAIPAAVAAGCSVGPPGIINTPSITVPHHTSEQHPRVHGDLKMQVVNAPRGGTVRMDLNYYSPGARKWEFAGRDSLAGPWRDGQHRELTVSYPCLRSGLRWRLYIVWDGVTADGKPAAGERFWPTRRGEKKYC